MTGRSALGGGASGPLGAYTYDAVCGANMGLFVLFVAIMLPTLLQKPYFGAAVKVGLCTRFVECSC
jgi:hypothetical protein